NVQSAKTRVHDAKSAQSVINGVAPIIEDVRGKYIDELSERLGVSVDYVSIGDFESFFGEDDGAGNAPLEVIQEAYRRYFVIPGDRKFEKTLFRFLLSRLLKRKD